MWKPGQHAPKQLRKGKAYGEARGCASSYEASAMNLEADCGINPRTNWKTANVETEAVHAAERSSAIALSPLWRLNDEA
jgi:hypothetical protein